MVDTLVTVDSILAWFKDITEHRKIVDAHTMVNAAMKLNSLIEGEHDKYLTLAQAVSQHKVKFIDIGEPTTRAKAKVEATDTYREMMRQKAKIKQIEEFIMIAKHMSRLKDNEHRNY